MSRRERIAEVIQRTEDRKTLRLLNREWWREWFTEKGENDREMHETRPSAGLPEVRSDQAGKEGRQSQSEERSRQR